MALFSYLALPSPIPSLSACLAFRGSMWATFISAGAHILERTTQFHIHPIPNMTIYNTLTCLALAPRSPSLCQCAGPEKTLVYIAALLPASQFQRNYDQAFVPPSPCCLQAKAQVQRRSITVRLQLFPLTPGLLLGGFLLMMELFVSARQPCTVCTCIILGIRIHRILPRAENKIIAQQHRNTHKHYHMFIAPYMSSYTGRACVHCTS